MDIRQIVQNAGMSDRPGYYSGRGATASDLNVKILDKIAAAIKEYYGDKALSSFIKMVWQMKVLSATAFLVNLYALKNAGWDLSRTSLTDTDNHFESEGEAWGLLASVLGGGSRSDATEEIRYHFRKS